MFSFNRSCALDKYLGVASVRLIRTVKHLHHGRVKENKDEANGVFYFLH